MEQIRKNGIAQRTDPWDLKGRVITNISGDDRFIMDVHSVTKGYKCIWVNCTYLHNTDGPIVSTGEIGYDGLSYNGKIVDKDGSDVKYGIYAFVPSTMITPSNKL